MNLKLLMNSSWTRIIGLTGLISILTRIISGKNLVSELHRNVWTAVLFTSLTAFLFNDSGVVACATCLALAFSFIIAKWEPHPEPRNAKILTEFYQKKTTEDY